MPTIHFVQHLENQSLETLASVVYKSRTQDRNQEQMHIDESSFSSANYVFNSTYSTPQLAEAMQAVEVDMQRLSHIRGHEDE